MNKLRFNLLGASLLALLIALVGGGCASGGDSRSAAEKRGAIDASVDAALIRFDNEVKGGNRLVRSAKGALIFPGVIQGGAIVGGEYGEGALRVGGRTVDYYNIASASFGLQLGAQKKDIIILFMDQNALTNFQASSGWTAGVDGAVTLVNVGAGASVDTMQINKPILGFVIGQTGLMGGISLEGSKITKLQR